MWRPRSPLIGLPKMVRWWPSPRKALPRRKRPMLWCSIHLSVSSLCRTPGPMLSSNSATMPRNTGSPRRWYPGCKLRRTPVPAIWCFIRPNRWLLSSTNRAAVLLLTASTARKERCNHCKRFPPCRKISRAETLAEIKLHPSGKFLYASNRGHDSIAVFSVTGKDGKLSRLTNVPTEKTPRSFDLDPRASFSMLPENRLAKWLPIALTSGLVFHNALLPTTPDRGPGG